MSDNRKISLCITHYNRPEMLAKSFINVVDDERIGEVIILDDCSTLQLSPIINDKVKVYSNSTNIGMMMNKQKTISIASNEWCILFDCDNVLDTSYIDKLYKIKRWDSKVIYNASFAKPNFDFRKMSGAMLDRRNIKRFARQRNFDALLNVCNYFVNRDEYMRVFQYNEAHKGTDTAHFLYLWLKAGNKIHVVPGMQYEHTVHDGSEFLKDLDYNMQKAKEIKDMILSLQ